MSTFRAPAYRALLCVGIIALTLSAGAAPAPVTNPARVIRVGTNINPPFSMKKADGTWEGLEIDLWRDMAAQLGLQYEIREMDFGALLNAVTHSNIDIAVGGITITGERERVLDFTHAFHAAGLAVAVGSKNHSRRHFQSMLEAFATTGFLQVMAALAGVLFIAATVVWLFERRRNPTEFGGGSAAGFGSGLWWAAVTVTGIGYGDKVPRTIGGRISAFICTLAGIIVISGLTATIAALMTVSHFEAMIRGPEDLPKFHIGTVANTTSAEYLHARHIQPHLYPTAAACLQALAHNEIEAFVFDEPILKYLAATLDGHVKVLPVILEHQSYGLALPLNSPLLRSIDIALLDETAGSAWQTIKRRYLGE